MKNLLLLTILSTCLCTACEEKVVIQPEQLHGYWQATTSSTAKLKIDANQWIEILDGVKKNEFSYTFHDDCKDSCGTEIGDACLKVGTNCYAIMKVTPDSMSLIYLAGNGQPIHFKRTAPFEILDRRPTPPGICFERRGENSLNVVQMSFNGQDVTGYMTMQQEGQHTGIGTLTGRIVSRKIWVDYKYTIQGSQQIEELTFELRDNHLYQAKGELMEVRDKLVLKEKSNVSYDIEYNQVDCKKVAEQLQWAIDQ